jgi:hypothetical protein
MPDPTTLEIFCAHCSGAVTLQMADWPLNLPDATKLTDQAWVCPYCLGKNVGVFAGRLAWVTKRIEPKGAH